jgi:hypothetical protein
MNHKFTAYKKSRTYGDIHGGRKRLRLRDNIFARKHSLKRPGANDCLPILMEDNPSRDFFYPITIMEANEALKRLPAEDFNGITHIWFRRIIKSEFSNQLPPLAEFVCGSGVRVIIIYPWRRDLIQEFGRTKPSKKLLAKYQRFCSSELLLIGDTWSLKWQLESLRQFYVYLLYHEIGHHVDWYMHHWSKANRREIEEAADQYAFQKIASSEYVFNNLQTNGA